MCGPQQMAHWLRKINIRTGILFSVASLASNTPVMEIALQCDVSCKTIVNICISVTRFLTLNNI